jgi:hypothetical protein
MSVSDTLRSILCKVALIAAAATLPAILAAQVKAPVSTAWDPWQEQHSTVTEPLRGIHAVGNGVAWASGAHGTVLRTEDSGFVWQRCTVPNGAAALDFRSVWAWDAQTAVVMSSGTGSQSRVYKTTDGCAHWKLLFTNTQEDGFFDTLAFSDDKNGFILGDPTGDGRHRRFVLLRTDDGGGKWVMVPSKDLATGSQKLGAFAASNQAMVLTGPVLATAEGPVFVPWFGTSGVSGGSGPFVYTGGINCTMGAAHSNPRSCLNRDWSFQKQAVPLAGGSESAGIFALGLRQDGQAGGSMHAVAVGGDYTKPDTGAGTAAYRDAKTGTWTACPHLPHGYRSAVAWDANDNAWIAVGPNGSDVSYDDGHNWSPIGNDGYNAISLPWVVGPDGRIGKFKSLKGQ